jgi:flagellar motility protein MotE (MotC chaperone)
MLCLSLFGIDGHSEEADGTDAALRLIEPVRRDQERPVQAPILPTMTDVKDQRSVDMTTHDQSCGTLSGGAPILAQVFRERRLRDLKRSVEDRISLLEVKIAQHEAWEAKRAQTLQQVRESFIAIYSTMKAEAAAERLAALDRELAAAVIVRLDSAKAAAILAEMDAERASQIANSVAASGVAAKSNASAAGDKSETGSVRP